MTNLSPCSEWADTLALKPNDLSPDERERLRAHLATCPGCAATYADYQSLMSRLRALPRPALPPLESLAPELLAEPQTPEQLDGLPDNLGDDWLTPPASASAPPTRLPPSRRHTWLQRLSAIAAMLLVTVLVGSLVAVLLHRGSSTGGQDLPLRPGWQQIVTYSGIGSKTITGQRVTLPYLWGSAFICKGSGAVSIKVTGPTYSGDFGADKCSSTAGITLSPNNIFLQTSIVESIDTIKVTASAGTSWYLQFTAAVPQPTFRLGPQWAYGIGGGGSGENSSLMGQGPPPTVNGQTLQSTAWGALFVCIGTGSGTIHLYQDTAIAPAPASQALSMSPCDGQPHLVTARYSHAVSITAISVDINGNLLWTAQLVGCKIVGQCAQD